MQWILLVLWSGVIIRGSRGNILLLRAALGLGLCSAMATQLWLLKADGLFAWEHVLPLHLCSLFGVLSLLMLLHAPGVLLEACCFLGAPCAFLTLFFPAVVQCSHPLLMKAAFVQLHVLVALMPLYFYCTNKPLPTDPRRTMVAGSGYLLFISLFNRIFKTNFLFLRAAPANTPLEWLFSRGEGFYVCALLMLAMLAFSWLKPLYAYFRK